MPNDTLRQGTTDTMVILTSTADSAGGHLEVEATYAPMANLRPPPMHYHPKQDERFRVLRGTLSVVVDGVPRTLVAGTELTVGKRRAAHDVERRP